MCTNLQVIISDSDIPSGSGGINREGYTYGQLRRQPIIPEVMRGISNPIVRRWAEECNARNRSGFVMRKVDGEYCFDGLHVGPKVALPSREEIVRRLGQNPTTGDIRELSYSLLREEIARQTGMSVSSAASAIGNMLDCVPHEDISGYVYMVPNWAHKWFRHRGYVSRILSQYSPKSAPPKRCGLFLPLKRKKTKYKIFLSAPLRESPTRRLAER